MQLFAKSKTILQRGFRATLNFWKIKVALNPLHRFFLNFAKSCILSCWLQFDNKKWGSPSSFSSYKHSKLKLRVFLAGHIIAMLTYCASKLTATCSWIIGQFVDTMILASTGIVDIMTHQTLSLGKYWKLFSATLNQMCYMLWMLDKSKGALTWYNYYGNLNILYNHVDYLLTVDKLFTIHAN